MTMGRKSKKVRDLSGASLNFDDMFGGAFDDPATKKKSTSPPEHKSSSRTPSTASRFTTTHASKNEVSEEKATVESTAQDLEMWLKQESDFKKLQQEIATLKERHQTERLQWEADKATLSTRIEQQKQAHANIIAPLNTEIKELRESLLCVQKSLSSHQEQLRVSKDEMSRVQEDMNRQQTEFLNRAEWIPLMGLLNERGLRTHSEYTNFFRVVGDSSHSWTVWKDVQVHRETMQQFLHEQVHLISKNIEDTSSIPGVCIPVDNSKCEMSGGVELLSETRELVTEFLLQGWNKLLILGVPRSFVNFLRHQLSQNTVEVQVDPREDKWGFTSEMNNYPVIVVFGGGREKIPQTCEATVFCYDHTMLGQGIQQCLKALQDNIEG